MKLLPKAVARSLPPLGGTEALGDEALVKVKFFTPDSNWTWYATEFDGYDTFFGLVDGFGQEMGYFSLSELESTRGPMGLPIERDRYWTPTTLARVKGGA